MKKNRLNRVEYFRKYSVRFWFHKLETEKNNQNQDH